LQPGAALLAQSFFAEISAKITVAGRAAPVPGAEADEGENDQDLDERSFAFFDKTYEVRTPGKNSNDYNRPNGCSYAKKLTSPDLRKYTVRFVTLFFSGHRSVRMVTARSIS